MTALQMAMIGLLALAADQAAQAEMPVLARPAQSNAGGWTPVAPTLPASPATAEGHTSPMPVTVPQIDRIRIPYAETPAEMQDLVRQIVLSELPHDYEDNRRWGMTKEVAVGLHVHRDGWHIKTKRRRATVNHGTWRRYRVTLIEPHRHLRLQMNQLRESSPGTARFNMEIGARLHAFARQAEWRRGVQFYSLSADADADVTIQLECETSLHLDTAKFPPDVILKPKILDARILLHEYQLQRLSKIDGPLAEEIGEAMRGVVLRKIEEKQPRLVEKINRQIDKNQDKLRLSLSNSLSTRWRKWTEGD